MFVGWIRFVTPPPPPPPPDEEWVSYIPSITIALGGCHSLSLGDLTQWPFHKRAVGCTCRESVDRPVSQCRLD